MSDFRLGLLGHPLSHSLSPALHNAALQYTGLRGNYRLIDIAPEKFTANSHLSLIDLLPEKLSGFNITIPYKEKIYQLVNEHTKEAIEIGAVNTVKIHPDGKLSGHNTDLFGFQESFLNYLNADLNGKNILLIGAGGAAKAVVAGLKQMEVGKIIVKSRNKDRLSSFIAETKISEQTKNISTQICSVDENNFDPSQISALINASPIGMQEEVLPSWLNDFLDQVPHDCVCFDLVYRKNKAKPAFAYAALQRKLPTIDGLPMLAYQAKEAFRYWTSFDVPAEIFLRALNL